MKRRLLLTFCLCALALTTAVAQNPQVGDYGYLYCHMNGNGRAWTAYALSRDGLNYKDLLNGDSVFSDYEHARIEGATRDAYIFRRHDSSGYLMLCTDMNVGAFKQLKKQAEWDNYGITLLRSDDLIHWESTSLDYRKGPAIFCDPASASVYKDWTTVNRVWAPQAVWDPTYRWPDGRQGGYFVYYSMWNRGEELYDRMYYSYADESFTQLTQPRLLFDWGYATIDADINWLESDRQWHMMIKKEGGQPGLFTSAAPTLTGPWPEPVADDYVNFEGKKKCEGVSAFQLAGEDDWTIGYIEYSSRPKNYRLCKADKFMRNFRDPQNIRGVKGPQHGSFLRLTREEYERLEAWGATASQSNTLVRSEQVLTDGWQFVQGPLGTSTVWQSVTVPHDWAISGPFDKVWDLQRVAIEQNGETEATEKSGRSGALPWIGEGHYRRTITIPEGFDGHAELVFDGAMAEPVVSVNGKVAGRWAYGYNTFRVDITKFVKEGENFLEVDLKNVEESSRWYPGAGLYRPVTLILNSQDARIDDWGITTTTELGKKKSPKNGDVDEFTIEVPIITADGKGRPVDLQLIDPDGKSVSMLNSAPFKDGKAIGRFWGKFKHWTPETPYLYKVRVTVYDGKADPTKKLYDDFGKVVDQKTFTVGIRTVKVSKEGGFQLNGVTRKLKGVCLHHDLGPLGAAVNKAALIRQIKTMKAMGCDAIRTSHNMPSQWQMDICDSLGMMVMAESFDMWVYPKCKNGYARFFREWADKDITNLVLANRRHPSIVMWSIGNEIPEQWSKEGTEIAAHLQNLCHRLDPTRPVTQGMDKAEQALGSGFAQVMDVPGFNYRVHKYENNMKLLPQGFLLGSETASTVSSRGVYKFPVVTDDNSRYASWAKGYDPNAIKTADGQCSSYDVEYCPWSNLPDDDWRWQDDYPWVIGEFVWTGYDYLGEPSPYDEYWPSRSSYFGICDLAGLPKDRYFLYRSHWNKDAHTIHLLPHWSWGTSKRQKGNRIGQVTPVYCYTDYPEAELFVNGKSQGRIKKRMDSGVEASKSGDGRLDRYRLRWNDVTYEPGELKVVVYDADGHAAGEQTLKTAGKPARLQLDTWTQASTKSPIGPISPMGPMSPITPSLKADGADLAFVTVSLVDAEGTLIADAADRLTFKVEGAGRFRAVCNGDATSLEPFTEPAMRLFNGQLVVVVEAARQGGDLVLTVSDAQRRLSQSVIITVK